MLIGKRFQPKRELLLNIKMVGKLRVQVTRELLKHFPFANYECKSQGLLFYLILCIVWCLWKNKKSNLSKKKREHLQTLLYRIENPVQQRSNIKFCRYLIASHNKEYIHINNSSEWNIIRHDTIRLEPII